MFDQVVAALGDGRRFAAGVAQSVACLAAATRGAARAGQQESESEHARRPDDDSEEEECAGGAGHVMPEDRERIREFVYGAGVGEYSGDCDNGRGRQNEKSEKDKDHGNSRRSTVYTYS
ncbi:hypothetical protein ACFQ1I_45195 [Kitasatospora arboriphila]